MGKKPARKQLRSTLKDFVALRRHEVMSVGQAMQGVPINSIPALCPGKAGLSSAPGVSMLAAMDA